MEYKNLNPLNKITKIIKRGITPKYTANKRINVINQRCIRDGRIDFSPVRFHDDSKKIQEDKILQNYDVLVNSTGVGTLGRVAQFKNISDKIYTVDSHVTILRPIDEIDKIYFGYAIKNKEPFITKMGEGSTGQTELSRDRLGEEVIINVPTLEIQKSIASIMYSLDKKIEVNEKIISNLEEQAQAIFKSWFIDFEPFQDGNFVESELGMIPEGWEVKNIKSLMEFETGSEPGAKNYSINKNMRIPFYRVGEMLSETNIFVKKNLLKDRVTSKEDVLVSFDGTVGRVVTGLVGGYSSGIKKITPKVETISSNLIYVLFKSKLIQDIINQNATGTTILHASKSIDYMYIPYNDEIYSNFSLVIDPLINIIRVLKEENKKLAEIRDALLPKLMSGEIDVSNIKIKGEEVKNE